VQKIRTRFKSIDARGGTFTLTWGGQTTGDLPWDCHKDTMASSLQLITGGGRVGINPIEVEREPKGNGFQWLVTFHHGSGDVAPLFPDYKLMEGYDPKVTVEEVVKGNADIAPADYTFEQQAIYTSALSTIGGSFKLEFEGVVSDAIPFNANKTLMKLAMEQLSTIYTVNVEVEDSYDVRQSALGARTWTVTFSHLFHESIQGAGDIGLIIPHYSGTLTGNNAKVSVETQVVGSNQLEIDIDTALCATVGAPQLMPGTEYYVRVAAYNSRGYGPYTNVVSATPRRAPGQVGDVSLAVASGTSLRLGWKAPLDIGGAAVSDFKLQWYTAQGTPEVQLVTTSAGEHIKEIQRVESRAVVDNVYGFFTLSFRGEQSRSIPHNALDSFVKESLELMSTIGTVHVTRSPSMFPMPGYASVQQGADEILCTEDPTSFKVPLEVGHRILIAGEEFTVRALLTNPFKIQLGDKTDHTTPASFLGETVLPNTELTYYRHAYGFDWTITFLHGHVGDQPAIVASASTKPGEGWDGEKVTLNTITMRQGLQPLSGTFRLSYKTHTTRRLRHNATALEMKDALSSIVDAGPLDVSRIANGLGHNWIITFMSDLGDVPQIAPNDVQLTGPAAKMSSATRTQGVPPSNLDSKIITSVVGKFDYSFTIPSLVQGLPYLARVTAQNSEGYGPHALSQPLMQTPREVPPKPQKAELIVMTDSMLKVVIHKSAVNGGAVITRYLIEWDTTANFANVATSGYRHIMSDITPGGSPYFYNVPALVSGTMYFFRVSAYNDQGYSPTLLTDPPFAKPASRVPGLPLDVTVASLSHNQVQVDWVAPSVLLPKYGGSGGRPISHYLIEWDTDYDNLPSPSKFIYDMSSHRAGATLSHIVGARDPMTGSIVSEIDGDVEEYRFRITAYNADGYGNATWANPSSIRPIDRVPFQPRDVSASAVIGSGTAISTTWKMPVHDGGRSVDAFQVQWDTKSSFENHTDEHFTRNLPVKQEVQSFSVRSSTRNEVQTVGATVQVINERQQISTHVTGVNEVQTITSSALPVVSEVQTITTYANDIDEIQVLTTTAVNIDEIQTVRTDTTHVDEVIEIEITADNEDEVQTITIVEQRNTQKIKIMHPNGVSTSLTQQTAKHTVTVDNGKQIQHILVVPGTDQAITSGEFALSYTDPVSGTTSKTNCISFTNGGVNNEAWLASGFSMVPPIETGASAEQEIVKELTDAVTGFLPANKVLSVQSVAYDGVGTGHGGGHGRFITITLNDDTEFADIFASTTDGSGNTCASIPNGGFVALNTNRQPGTGIPTLPHLPGAPADLGNPWVGSGAKFQMTFPFSTCTLCKRKVDFATADIKPEVIEPAGAPDLSSCPVNGFKCEVERAMQNAGFSANQITFSYATDLPATSDGIRWEMTFTGDEVKGAIPAATISSNIQAGDIAIGSKDNQHRIMDTTPFVVVDGATTPGQMGGFMIKSFDGTSENIGNSLCLGWDAAMDGSVGDDHTLRGVLLDVGVTLGAAPTKSAVDGGTEFILKISSPAKPYQLRIHNVGCQPFQPVGNNGDGTDPLFVAVDSNSLSGTFQLRFDTRNRLEDNGAPVPVSMHCRLCTVNQNQFTAASSDANSLKPMFKTSHGGGGEAWMQAKLSALTNIGTGGVLVSMTDDVDELTTNEERHEWQITFQGAKVNGNVPELMDAGKALANKFTGGSDADSPTFTISTSKQGNEIDLNSTIILQYDPSSHYDNPSAPVLTEHINISAPAMPTLQPNEQGISMAEKLMALTSVGSVLVTKTDKDDGVGGFVFTITFTSNHGDLSPVTCLKEENGVAILQPSQFSGGGGSSGLNMACTATETTKGNFLGGQFRLKFTTADWVTNANVETWTPLLNWDASAADIKNALEAISGVGTLQVNRSRVSEQPSWNGGFLWDIEFLSHKGDVVPLVAENQLNSTNSVGGHNITVGYATAPNPRPNNFPAREVDGNQIRGSFRLDFDGATTGDISVYATAAELMSELKLLANLDDVAIARSDPDHARGYQWTITFSHPCQGGNVAQLKTATNCGAGNNEVCESLTGTQSSVGVQTTREGNELTGSFKLHFGAEHTGAINFDESAANVETQLELLSNIGDVSVNRYDAPMQATEVGNAFDYNTCKDAADKAGLPTTNPAQVKAYTWQVTFLSQIHSGVDSDSTTWTSPPAARAGYSTSWGRNVGDQPNIQCETTNLKTVTQSSETQTCKVNDGSILTEANTPGTFHDGTEPLKGTFRINFDTSTCATCDVQGNYTTDGIRHNAKATRAESNGDGTSLEERLEALPNIGDVDVTRGPVSVTTGGYVWTIVFQRDADGQSGACTPSDGSESTGCQSPGDVPALVPVYGVNVGFGGTQGLVLNHEIDRGNVLRGDFKISLAAKVTGIQCDSSLNEGKPNANFVWCGGDGLQTGPQAPGWGSTTEKTVSLPWNAGALAVKAALAPGTGDPALNGLTGLITVDVTRVRVGKFGAYTWNVTFTENHGQHPPGAGDMPDLVVDAALLTESNHSAGPASPPRIHPTVVELQKGSEGLSSTFQLNFRNAIKLKSDNVANGVDATYRTFRFNHLQEDVEVALEDLETISDVHVTREIHGAGWNRIPVNPAVEPQAGGYKWRITFVRNFGPYDGQTFPPGSGDVPSLDWKNNLVGDGNTVSINETTKGAVDLGGFFNLTVRSVNTNGAFTSATTSLLPYSATAPSVETAMDALVTNNALGNVSTIRDFSLTKQLPGYMRVEPGDAFIEVSNVTEVDLTSILSRGDIVRVGGGTGGAGSASEDSVGTPGLNGTNGDLRVGAAITKFNQSYIRTTTDLRQTIFPGQRLRLGGRVYEVKDWDAEVHSVTIEAGSASTEVIQDKSADHGEFQLCYAGNCTKCIRWAERGSLVATQLETFIPSISGVAVSLKQNSKRSITYSIMFNGPLHVNGDIAASQKPADIGAGIDGVRLGVPSANYNAAGANAEDERLLSVLDGAACRQLKDGNNANSVLTYASDMTSMSSVTREGVGDGKTLWLKTPYQDASSESNGAAEDSSAVGTVDVYAVAEIFAISTDTSKSFTRTRIPLARTDSDATEATIVGPLRENLRLYKVDGHLYTVRFDTNLGNVPALAVNGDDLVGEDILSYSTDDVVQGVLPLSLQISGLSNGVPYYVRVRAHSAIGWSEFSDPIAKQAPMTVPSAPTFTWAGYAAHVDEIQTITTAATHVDEIQTITTTGINVDEIQTITTTAPMGGGSIAGKFSLSLGNWATHMDIQTLVMKSAGARLDYVEFRLTYNGQETAACIPFNATAADVQAALLAAPVSVPATCGSTANQPCVSVARSEMNAGEQNDAGGSTVTYTFGFDSWNAGSPDQAVLAAVPEMTVAMGAAAAGCHAWQGGVNHTNTIATLSQGGFDIAHDASASFVQDELRLLPGIGKTFVTRSLADDQGGYMFSITMLDLQRNQNMLACHTNDDFDAVVGALCTPRTLVDGNQLGGYFTLTYNGQTTAGIQHDASADDVKTRLTSLDHIQDLVVTRTTNPDDEGGYSWTVQFTTNLGDLGPITSTSSLTGTGALITILEKQKGNWIGGTFTLSYLGKTTHPIKYDATATEFSTELSKLSTVDQILVARSESPDTQRGYTWSVTFVADTMRGDLPLLTAGTELLTGIGRNVYAREQRKGSEAVGTNLHVSFGVPPADGGAAVTSYKIEYDTTSSFASGGMRAATISGAQALFEVQRIFLTTPLGTTLDSTQTYRLNYLNEESGHITPAISSVADQNDLRDALESLRGIDAVNIVPEYEDGDNRRANGHSYTITFVSVSQTSTLTTSSTSSTGSITTMLDSPELNTAFDRLGIEAIPSWVGERRIAGVDCASCHYLSGLTMGAKYFIRTRACNEVGCSEPREMNTSVVPRQLPSAPTAVKLYVVSGTELEVFFNPPSNIGGAIVNEYVIEWDTVSSFNSKGVGRALGSASVTGGAIAGSPPFSKVIGTSSPLNTSTPYYVRVAAANGVPVQQVSYTQSPPDNRNWEITTPTFATPENQPPNAPDSVELSLLSGTALRILIKPPTRQGGVEVSKYLVEYSTTSSFTTDTTSQLETPAASSLKSLKVTGRIVVDIPNLTPGQIYYVRVFAYNGVLKAGMSVTDAKAGYGDFRLSTPAFSIPQRSPEGPREVRIKTVAKQATPIRHTDVQWMSPTTNGGASIDAYKVEWWTNLVEHEVQSIHVSNSVPGDHNGTFFVRYAGKVSGSIQWDVRPEDLRWKLMHIVNGAETNNDNFLIGDLEVSRATTGAPNFGYKWMITFKDANKNPGNVQPLLVDGGGLNSQSGNIQVVAKEETRGVRAGGVSEIQRITSSAECTEGFFRIALAGSTWSPYLAHDVSDSAMELAIETLSTVGDVSVTRVGSGAPFAWLVTFNTNVGDVPTLQLDVAEMPAVSWIPSSMCKMEVTGGDNKVFTSGDDTSIKICLECRPGETPWQYHVVTLSPQIRTYQIQQLVTGTEYFVRLSASNARGFGSVALSHPTSIVPPFQVPGQPTQIAITTKPNANDQLYVNYVPPLSDAGTEIMQYRIEWDTSSTFGSAISKEVRCPTWPVNEIQQVTITPPAGHVVSGGTFQLELTYQGVTETTGAIQWDEVAQQSDEVAGPTARGALGVWKGDDVSSCRVCANCEEDTGNLHKCTGSVQSQLHRLANVKGGSVHVQRTSTTNYGGSGYTWSITFMEVGDVPAIKVVSNQLQSQNAVTAVPGTMPTAVATQVGDGALFSDCTAQQTITGLIQGTPYFVRVSAFNQNGYGLPAGSTPASQKPMVVSGPPTGVTLQVVSATSLRIFMNPPQDDGGDTVTKYKVQWDVDSTFSTAALGTHELTMLSGGAPFIYTVPRLTMGQRYYLRVAAYNQMGYGPYQTSSPEFETPRRLPTAPTNVRLGVTSTTKLTVAFDLPGDIGGDAISHFKIEWDRVSNFQSRHSLPHKGEVEVSAVTERSYTISPPGGLSENVVYYVRVSARNRVGYGAVQWAEPPFAVPIYQIPGKVSSLTAAPQAGVNGNLTVTWNYPRVPAHGLFCGGGGPNNTNILPPTACPVGMGRGTEADGGTPIQMYTVEWDTFPTFNSSDAAHNGKAVITNLQSGEPFSYTINSLTPTKNYYVRVSAHNAQGESAMCNKEGLLCDGVVAKTMPDGTP
jgi:hypothetical protein